MTRARDIIKGLNHITEGKATQQEIEFAIEKSLSSWDRTQLKELFKAVSKGGKNPLIIAKARNQIGAIGGLNQKDYKLKDIEVVLDRKF